jgi:hypothetical protein
MALLSWSSSCSSGIPGTTIPGIVKDLLKNKRYDVHCPGWQCLNYYRFRRISWMSGCAWLGSLTTITSYTCIYEVDEILSCSRCSDFE